MKLSLRPSGNGRCAVPRLSASLCAILTTLLLFACASAQAQWTRSNTYYGASFVTSVTHNTTPTKTVNSGTGTADIESSSTTTNDQNGYSAAGHLYGYVYQDFNWGGQGSTDLFYDAAESVSGSGGSASSSAGDISGATDPPYTPSYSAASPQGHGGGAFGFSAPPTTYTTKEWMQVDTTAYYPRSATAKATIVFGIHVFDPGP